MASAEYDEDWGGDCEVRVKLWRPEETRVDLGQNSKEHGGVTWQRVQEHGEAAVPRVSGQGTRAGARTASG